MNAAWAAFLRPLAWCLLHFLWQGALLGLLAWGGLWLLRKGRPEVRYGLGCVLLLTMAAAPVTSFLWLQGHPEPVDVVVVGRNVSVAAHGLSWGLLEAVISPWLPAILWTYMAGVGTLSLRLAGSWAWLQAFRWRGTRHASLDLQLTARALSRRMGLHQAVRVLESTLAEVPMAIGVFKPVVLIPTAALLGLEPAALEAILAHELAHVRRHDYLVNLLQTLLETVLFYHPAVWWLSRQIRAERELCCDDQAVAQCGDPLLYSRALARLEELRASRKPAPQLAAAATGGSLMNRIQRLLLPALSPMLPSRGALLAGVATSLVAAAGLAYAQEASTAKPRAIETKTASEAASKEHEALVLITEKGKGKRVSVKLKGDVDLKPDTKALAALEDGAKMKIEIREDGKTRSLDLSREGGKETRTYTVDGKEAALDAESERAFQEQLQSIKERHGALEILSGKGDSRGIKVYTSREGGVDGNKRSRVYVFRGSGSTDLHDLEPDIHKHLEEATQGKEVIELDLRKQAEEVAKEIKDKNVFEIEIRKHTKKTEEGARKAEEEIQKYFGDVKKRSLHLKVLPRDLHIDLDGLKHHSLVLPEDLGESGTLRFFSSERRGHRDPQRELKEIKTQMERLEARMKKLQEDLAKAAKDAPHAEVETRKEAKRDAKSK